MLTAMLQPIAALVLALALIDGAAPVAGESLPALETRIFRLFSDGDYRAAAPYVEQYLKLAPNDAPMLYNAACVYCSTGEIDRAADYLLQSVKAGFRDFTQMKRDPDLEPLRQHPTYEAIVEAAERVAKTPAKSALDHWKEIYGDKSYRYERDEKHNLAYATALDRTSHREMRQMLEKQADHLINTLFGEPPRYNVLIAVPTPEDASKLFDDERVGGIYEHDKRRLIARNSGGSLRHEFFHAMHFGHPERLGQLHRLWITEGLASLYEDYELNDDGSVIRFLPNERRNIAKNLARAHRLMKWPDLMKLSDMQFMRNAGQLYPQVRAIFEFTAAQGKLTAWYRAYTENFQEDETGKVAFETTFGMSLPDVEKWFRKWLDEQKSVDTQILPGDAALGIVERPNGANDGVAIDAILPGSAAARNRLQPGDVIVAVNDRPVRSMNELINVIGGKQVGDSVSLRIRRNQSYFNTIVRLRGL